jgi:Aerotolerance regulator N-terminal
MTFLNPILAAVALSCIAIPIVIHILMRKRRRPVEWGAMRFLIEAYKKQRKRLNLEQLLLLASRVLLVALLAMAVGKPILQAAGAIGPRGPRTLYLLIDNSITASAIDSDGKSALERHKATAVRLSLELEQSRGDRIGILTLASPAEALILPATVDLSGVAGVIRDIPATDAKADFAGALEKLRDLREQPEARKDEGGAYLAVLSDFRVGSVDVDQSLSAFAGAAVGSRIIAIRPSSKVVSNVAVAEVSPLESVLLGGAGERTALPVRVGLRRSGESGAGISKVRLEAMPQSRTTPGAMEGARGELEAGRRDGVCDSDAGPGAWRTGQRRGADCSSGNDRPRFTLE